MTRTPSPSRRVFAVALGIASLAAADARAQGASASSQELPAVVSRDQMIMAPYIVAADVTVPVGVNPNLLVGGSPPVSGNPVGFNDPTLGFNNTRYWAKGAQYSGVARLIMTYQARNNATGATSTAAFLCTGALINGGNDVLTAAHCVSPLALNSATTTYTLQTVQTLLGQNFAGNFADEPGTGALGPGQVANQSFSFNQTVSAPRARINPLYTGAVIDAHDIAVINLNTPAPASFQSYALYAPSGLGQSYNVVGWGGRGNGNIGTVNAGGSTGSGARIRQGRNDFDVSFADPLWNPAFLVAFGLTPEDVYLSDFDNGLGAQNALCRLTGATFGGGQPVWLGDAASQPCGLGLGINEVNTAGGDSGGPSFINGQIAGITSFGITFGLGDILSGLNSSFGEMSGMTRVDVNAAFVASVATVPEPATLGLVAGGLLGLLVAARRRRQT